MLFLDRAQESFATTRTGTITLGGAPSGWRTMAAALLADHGLSGTVTRVCYYAVNAAETIWEFGYGTVDTVGGTITRNLIASSTGSLISWVAGTKYIFSTLEAILYSAHLTHFRAATAPAHARAGYTWEDISGGATATLLKIYDGADWITIGTINETANTFVPAGAALLASANTLTAANAFQGLVDAQQDVRLSGDISPAQLTANTDNWNPTGLSAASVIRLSTDASRNITGLAGGADGRVLFVMNVGGNDLVLKHDATSTAANRFYCPNSTDYTLRANSSAVLVYDSTSSRWRVVNSAASTTLKFAILRDEKADGTNGGTGTATAWTKRDINTEQADPDGIVSLASNEFTLGAGTYLIEWESAFQQANYWTHVRTKLRNVTDAADVILSISNSTSGGSSANQGNYHSTGRALVTIAGTKAFAIMYYINAAGGTDDLGEHDNMTIGVEVYLSILLIKIA